MENLQRIKTILQEASKELCLHLDPRDVLLTMKSAHALENDDVNRIKREETDSERVELLLDILPRKPQSSYEVFVEALKEKRPNDLYPFIRKIEEKYNFKHCKY